MMGPRDGRVFAGRPLAEVVRDDSDCISLSAEDVADRFPWLRPDPGTITIYEPRAGVLGLEACLEASLDAAADADLHFDEPVAEWSASASGVRIRTDRREYRARRLAIAAGAWTPQLLPGLGLPARGGAHGAVLVRARGSPCRRTRRRPGLGVGTRTRRDLVRLPAYGARPQVRDALSGRTPDRHRPGRPRGRGLRDGGAAANPRAIRAGRGWLAGPTRPSASTRIRPTKISSWTGIPNIRTSCCSRGAQGTRSNSCSYSGPSWLTS